ncbi:PH domain-containing protein DDB_G0267786-like [Sycon ciliatum]|uniref:PH domain-containing protein DDB_G0267786-like n=1 Tax=Sycon ciliatum TaxID=27933 RepID=UPI0031F615B3
MGNIVGGPLNEAKQQEIKELIEAVLLKFTEQYTKVYAVALLDKVIEEISEQPEEWQLLERPEASRPTEPLKQGYLTKQGAVRKNWLKRYFVVRADYKIEYYESEDAFKNSKSPKGTIVPCSFTVQHDPVKNRLEDLAETAQKMGALVADLPKPDPVPDFCFELYHPRRRCFFIQAENNEEKQEWLKVFERCRYKSRALSDDPVANTAFIEAVNATRRALRRYGWWYLNGSESQILTDVIVWEVDHIMMADIYREIKGPMQLRWMARNQVMKALDTSVSGAVATSLQALTKTISMVREKVEPVMRSKMTFIVESKEKIQEKIKDACLCKIEPVLAEKVAPRLTGVLNILFSPMADAFSETRAVFDDSLDEMIKKVETDSGFGPHLNVHFKNLDRAPRSWWTMRKANKKTRAMEVPLWGLRQFFDDVSPNKLINKAQDTLALVLDNAMYTFENNLAEMTGGNASTMDVQEAKSAILKCKESVMEKFSEDAHKATTSYFKDIMVMLCMPVMLKALAPVCEPIIEPIASTVPDELSDILDVEKLYEETVEKIVQGAVDAVVDPACQHQHNNTEA